MNKIALLAAGIFFLSSGGQKLLAEEAKQAQALSKESFIGRVVDVKAGDSLVIMWKGQPVIFKVAGTLCPKGARGAEALKWMKNEMSSQSVLVTPLERLSNGVYVADVRRINGDPITKELIEKGLAKPVAIDVVTAFTSTN